MKFVTEMLSFVLLYILIPLFCRLFFNIIFESLFLEAVAAADTDNAFAASILIHVVVRLRILTD